MSIKDKVSSALLTDMGRVRTNNEDSVAEDVSLGLFVLADGMGGYNAGEVASGITIASVINTVRAEEKTLFKDKVDPVTGHRREALMLRHAIETAHTTIYHVSQSQPQCAGMGTTVVACMLRDDHLSIAYVGDSRLYRLRNGVLEQITRDHSLVEELIARGHYSRPEAMKLVRKNIVTRALGVEPQVTVDLIEETVEAGDIILLCSDGLSDMCNDEIIRKLLVGYADDLNEAARKLVEAANSRGGKDNISVVLVRINSGFMRKPGWFNRLVDWF